MSTLQFSALLYVCIGLFLLIPYLAYNLDYLSAYKVRTVIGYCFFFFLLWPVALLVGFMQTRKKGE